jgi:hypothetical protein
LWVEQEPAQRIGRITLGEMLPGETELSEKPKRTALENPAFERRDRGFAFELIVAG